MQTSYFATAAAFLTEAASILAKEKTFPSPATTTLETQSMAPRPRVTGISDRLVRHYFNFRCQSYWALRYLEESFSSELLSFQELLLSDLIVFSGWSTVFLFQQALTRCFSGEVMLVGVYPGFIFVGKFGLQRS